MRCSTANKKSENKKKITAENKRRAMEEGLPLVHMHTVTKLRDFGFRLKSVHERHLSGWRLRADGC